MTARPKTAHPDSLCHPLPALPDPPGSVRIRRYLAAMRALVCRHLCRRQEIVFPEAREIRVRPPAERLRDQSWPVSCVAG